MTTLSEILASNGAGTGAKLLSYKLAIFFSRPVNSSSREAGAELIMLAVFLAAELLQLPTQAAIKPIDSLNVIFVIESVFVEHWKNKAKEIYDDYLTAAPKNLLVSLEKECKESFQNVPSTVEKLNRYLSISSNLYSSLNADPYRVDRLTQDVGGPIFSPNFKFNFIKIDVCPEDFAVMRELIAMRAEFLQISTYPSLSAENIARFSHLSASLKDLNLRQNIKPTTIGRYKIRMVPSIEALAELLIKITKDCEVLVKEIIYLDNIIMQDTDTAELIDTLLSKTKNMHEDSSLSQQSILKWRKKLENWNLFYKNTNPLNEKVTNWIKYILAILVNVEKKIVEEIEAPISSSYLTNYR